MARDDGRQLVDLLRQAADAVERGAAVAQDTEPAPQPESEQPDEKATAADQFREQLREAQSRSPWIEVPFY
jgi:hypothetical protein